MAYNAMLMGVPMTAPYISSSPHLPPVSSLEDLGRTADVVHPPARRATPTEIYAKKWIVDLCGEEVLSDHAYTSSFCCSCARYAKNKAHLDLLDGGDHDPCLKDYRECNWACCGFALACLPTLGILGGTLTGLQSTRIRKLYNISGNTCQDIAGGICCQPCTLTRNALEVHHRETERKYLGLPPANAVDPGYAAPQPMLVPLANLDSVLLNNGHPSPVLTGSPATQNADPASPSAVGAQQARAIPIYPVGKAHKTELSTVNEGGSTDSALSRALSPVARALKMKGDENQPGRATSPVATPKASGEYFHPRPLPQKHSLAATVTSAEDEETAVVPVVPQEHPKAPAAEELQAHDKPASTTTPVMTWWPAREHVASADSQPAEKLAPKVHDFAHDHLPAKNTPLIERESDPPAVPDDAILPLAPVERGPREHGIEEDSMVPL